MSLLKRRIRVLDEIAKHTEEFAVIVSEHEGQIGIEFEKNYGLHDCNGAGKNGSCWYIDKHQSKFALVEIGARHDDEVSAIVEEIAENNGSNGYLITRNGKLLKVTHEDRTIFLINMQTEKILSLAVKTDDEKLYTNHVLSFYNILEGKGIDSEYKLSDVPKKEEKQIDPIASVKAQIVADVEEMEKKEKPTSGKVYTSEEELLAELGITR